MTLLTMNLLCFLMDTVSVYRDDPDLDKALKDRIRWGDPMGHLVKVIKRRFMYSLQYGQLT